MNNNMLRYEKLKAQRPSIVRAHAGSFMYWLICSLLAFVFLVLGIGLLINAGFQQAMNGIINRENLQVPADILKMVSIVVGCTCILLSILFFIIARLSKKIIRRTNYIMSLEEVMDGELNPEPNYVQV
jgi:hypothetical protein